jgi:hypothetical protein
MFVTQHQYSTKHETQIKQTYSGGPYKAVSCSYGTQEKMYTFAKFWDVTPSSLLQVYLLFRETCRPH